MFNLPTFDEIRNAILRDTQSLDPTADISPDSDHFVHASRLAACASGQYAHQAWLVRQIFPDTADTAYLERHAALRGITRKNATLASGVATVQGVADSVVLAGLQIKQGERFFTTQQTVRIGSSGVAKVNVVASEAGSTSNVAQAAGQFMAAPAGVQSECVVSTQGGVDAESDASLLDRLLERLRRPPAGGNQYDYKNWALSVDGVTNAFVYPLRRGLGTVDIAIVSGNDLPSDSVIRQTQDYIDSVRPVTAKNVRVFAPDAVAIDVQVQLKLDGSTTLDKATAEVQAALQAYFATLALADDLIVSQIQTAISNVQGVIDRVLLLPVANRVAQTQTAMEWFRLGRVNVSALP